VRFSAYIEMWVQTKEFLESSPNKYIERVKFTFSVGPCLRIELFRTILNSLQRTGTFAIIYKKLKLHHLTFEVCENILNYFKTIASHMHLVWQIQAVKRISTLWPRSLCKPGWSVDYRNNLIVWDKGHHVSTKMKANPAMPPIRKTNSHQIVFK
jgi:hypothetical protein